MFRYVVKRILILIPTMLALAIIAFLLINLIPGDPASMVMGTENVASNIDMIREKMGLNKSLMERLFTWLINMLHGDFGDTYFQGRTVIEAIGERLPVTFSLAVLALLFSVLFGIPMGILASLKPNTLRDTGIMSFSLLGVSIPEFFLGVILIYIFSLGLGWLPTGGYVTIAAGGVGGWLKSLLLPAISLGMIQAAYIARLMRSSMLDVLNQEYVTTARSKGQFEFVIVMKHAFRNAVLPVVTAVGMVFALLLSGAFITEYLFRLPGAGSLIISSIKKRDYPVVSGALVIFSGMTLLVNLVVDILYAFIDPRVRYGKKE